MKFKEVKEILLKHKMEFSKKYGIKEIGIFGSFARGEEKEISDIDVYIEFEKPIGWEFVDLCEELEILLGTKVDVLTKNAVLRKPLLWESIKEDLIYV
jgi:predicted nucleotidyltransferase